MRVLAIVQEADAGPGVFAEAAAARGDELDEWLIAEGGDPPADPHGYDAVMVFGGAMNVDEEGEHPWLGDREGPAAGAARGRDAAARRLPRRPAAGRGGGGGAAARAAAGDRLATGRADRRRRARTRCSASLATALQRLPVAQLRDAARRRRGAGRGATVCLQARRFGPLAWAIQFHAEVSEPTPLKWIDDYESDPDAVAIGLDPEALAAETRERIGAWNELGRALCARFLDSRGQSPAERRPAATRR